MSHCMDHKMRGIEACSFVKRSEAMCLTCIEFLFTEWQDCRNVSSCIAATDSTSVNVLLCQFVEENINYLRGSIHLKFVHIFNVRMHFCQSSERFLKPDLQLRV